jgi:hypothetical protein
MVKIDTYLPSTIIDINMMWRFAKCTRIWLLLIWTKPLPWPKLVTHIWVQWVLGSYYMIDFSASGSWFYGVLCLCVLNKVLLRPLNYHFRWLACIWLVCETLHFVMLFKTSLVFVIMWDNNDFYRLGLVLIDDHVSRVIYRCRDITNNVDTW